MGGVFFFWLDEMGCLISLLCTSVRLHDAPDCGRAPIHLSSPASTQTAVIRWMCPAREYREIANASRTSGGLIDAACWLKYSEPCPHPIHPSIHLSIHPKWSWPRKCALPETFLSPLFLTVGVWNGGRRGNPSHRIQSTHTRIQFQTWPQSIGLRPFLSTT
jgi:hypothetical protein